MIKKCRRCGKEMKCYGFPLYNERYECTKCGLVFIPMKSRFWGKFMGYPKYLDWKNFNEEEDE